MQHSAHSPVREFSVADAKAGPYGITTGPDDALWLTLAHSGEVARLAVDGELSRYPAGSAACMPTIITAGPDGALWFTRSADHHIGRIDLDGRVTLRTLPTADAAPVGIPDDVRLPGVPAGVGGYADHEVVQRDFVSLRRPPRHVPGGVERKLADREVCVCPGPAVPVGDELA